MLILAHLQVGHHGNGIVSSAVDIIDLTKTWDMYLKFKRDKTLFSSLLDFAVPIAA